MKKKIDFRRKSKIKRHSNIYIIILVGLIYFFYMLYTSDERVNNRNYSICEKEKHEIVKGKVIEFYKDRENRNIFTVLMVTDSSQNFKFTNLAIEDTQYHKYLEVGDILEKPLGTLDVHIKKSCCKDSVVILKARYRCEDLR